MNSLAFFITCALLVSFSHAIASDYCVGDLSLPMGPAGYACKNPNNVTVDDFIFTGFRTGGPTNNIFKNNVNLAFANAYPGLNGLGISMGRLDFGVGGVIPMHTHRTSEVLILIKGKIVAGFIDTNDVAFYKTLEVGDVMVFPEGLLHFQANVGNEPALAFVSLSSPNPGIQVTSSSLFGGNLPAELVERTVLLDHSEVIKLRKIFSNA